MIDYVTEGAHWHFPAGTKCKAWYSDYGRITNLLFKGHVHTHIKLPGAPIMWATQYIEQLKLGQTVQFRPHGNSMQPRIESGQLVTVKPGLVPLVGDVVLCKVDGRQWLHLVTAIGSDGRYQISNNKGHINGWCQQHNVFGVVVMVEP